LVGEPERSRLVDVVLDVEIGEKHLVVELRDEHVSLNHNLSVHDVS